MQSFIQTPSPSSTPLSSLYLEPLPPNHFRLLHWQPAPAESAIHLHFNLELAPLDQQAPSYYALSYRWSDPDPSSNPECRIVVNHVELPIGPTAYAALLQISAVTDRTVPVWNDYLCIDQVNLVEKQRQILLMPQVYHRAALVIICIGPDIIDAEALRAMQNLIWFIDVLDAVDESLVPSRSKPLTEMQSQVHQVILQLSNHPPTPIFEGIARLFGRPWFARIWTLQEAALASDTSFVLYGGRHFPYERLMHLTERYVNDSVGHWVKFVAAIGQGDTTLDPENPPRPVMSHLKTVRRMRAILKAADPKPVPNTTQTVRLLNYLRVFDSTDPRDRILSASAFLPAELVAAIYDAGALSTEALYVPFATVELDTYRNVQCLAAAGLSQQRRSYPHRYAEDFPDHVLKLPSWVPDWTFRKIRESLWVLNEDSLDAGGAKLYTATGESTSSVSIRKSTQGNAIAVIKGIGIDIITDHCEPHHIARIPANHHTVEDLETLLELYLDVQSQVRKYIELGLRHLNPAVLNASSSKMSSVSLIRKVLIGNVVPRTAGATFSGAWVKAEPEQIDRLFENLDSDITELQDDFERMKSHPQDSSEAIDVWYKAERIVKEAAAAGKIDELVADTMSKIASADSRPARNALLPMASTCKGRTFFVTRDGRIGMGPDILAKDDLIWLILGGCTPFVLRPSKTSMKDIGHGSDGIKNSNGLLYELVGECYVEGLMDGEGMNVKGVGVEEICLI